MELGLRGKSVLVTGGTRGIGRATALAFAGEGAHVTVTYASDEEAANAVVAELEAAGGSGAAARMDLADADSIAAAVATATERTGGLDVLVGNAVRWPFDASEPLGESDPETWTRVLRTNLEGTAACLRAALPPLGRSDAGRVVLISSGVAHSGLPGATAYTAAKAGLEGLVATLKWEAGEQGVLVNVVSPGVTTTENNVANIPDEVRESFVGRTPSGRLSEPADVARTVLFLGSPANGNVTGEYLSVSGGAD
jgi:NAD(P)-dependent dehydrogenase (short-subunit alcohol dehydrogenase family)